MRTLLKLAFVGMLVVAATMIASPAGAAANSCPGAMHLAMTSPCMTGMEMNRYQMSCNIVDHGTGNATVSFVMAPKCLYGPVPCAEPSELMVLEVNCESGMVICSLPVPIEY